MTEGFTEPLYKIQEQDTTGWNDITEPLTQENCKVQYDFHISQGTAPNRLKIIKVQ